MAKSENFTAGRIAKLECEPGKQQTIYSDAKTPGLGLRVTAAGAKSYIFETRLHGKTMRVTIGDARTWTVGKAQAEAASLKTLTDQGLDPREQKAERRAKAEATKTEADRRDMLLSEVWREYMEARKHKWGARHLADHVAAADPGGRTVLRGKGITKPGALAALMPLKLGHINAEQVKTWLRDEAAHRPTQAGLAFRLLAAFLRWCEDTTKYRGIASPDACSTRIARDVLPKRTAKRDSLQREQLRDWFTAVRAISSPTIAAYLQILLLTGPRREELAGLKWEDVDFKWNTLTIRDKDESKGGEDGFRTIPLTPYVAELLTELKARNDTPPPRHRILHGKKIENDLANWKPSPWVFTSKTAATGRLTDPTRQHYEACAAASIESLTLHGLRRSFGTLSEWCEVPAGIVAQIQGHKPSATAEKHYRVRPVDLLRMWHTKIEAWILKQAGIKFDQTDKQENAGVREVAREDRKVPV
jgi:integrase